MKKSKTKPKSKRFLAPFILLLTILLAVVVAITIGVVKQANIISKYEAIEKIDNQACIFLHRQSLVRGRFDLRLNAKEDQPKLVYKCGDGSVFEAQKIHGKRVGEYESGATVMYFASSEAAEQYAEKNLNPLRNWSVDDKGQQNGIPQTSKFTFIVNDDPVPYYDAYTVQDNALVRLSLSCQTEGEGVTDCQDQASSNLIFELKRINF